VTTSRWSATPPPSRMMSPRDTSLLGQLRRQRTAYLIGTLLLLVQQGLMYGRDQLFRKGVDAATKGAGQTAANAALLALVVIVSASGVRVLSRLVVFNGGRAAEYELRGALLAKLHTLGTGFFRKIPTGDIMSRATNDLTQVRLLLGFGVLNVVNTAFALISALSVMLQISGPLTLAALASAPLLVLVTRWFSKQMFQTMRDNQQALGQLSERVQASLTGVRVVRGLSLEDAEMASFGRSVNSYLDKSLALARVRGSMGPIMGAVASIGVVTVFLYGGHLVLTGAMTNGDFVAFSAALSRLIWPLLAMGFVTSILSRGRAGYDRLRVIFDAVPDVVDGPLPAPKTIHGSLRVQGLSFRHGERAILDDVGFEVPAGQSLAIVGRTGSGKSTLAALLPRLLPTPEGTVFLDDFDVTRLPVRAVRSAIGYAQQDAFLFSSTVEQNIGFSLPIIDDAGHERIREAAREAQVLSEIESLPDGFDTVVGERGVQLSGGQRQRVALARAFLREPPILVLDDPLSAVDARTEALILEAIERQAKKRTLLLITHRVSAASRCDAVIVLDGGKIVERGRHDDLIAQGGLYAAFAEEQQEKRESAAEIDPLAVEGALV
jgi:ATP-binding cassette, subfamily B, multidrug efflux pump